MAQDTSPPGSHDTRVNLDTDAADMVVRLLQPSSLSAEMATRCAKLIGADLVLPGQRSSYAAGLDEQARRKSVRPISSVDELRAEVFESDEELDEFLADLAEFRHQDRP